MGPLLTTAFGVPQDQIVNMPAWAEDLMGPTQYEITAAMPPETTKGQFQLMMQSLLADRFHLAFHHETRDFPAYELMVAPGGLKIKEVTPDPNPAPPGTAPKLSSLGSDGFLKLPPGPNSMVMMRGETQRMKFQERTMAEFVTNLGTTLTQALGTDLTQNPGRPRPRVVDKTGLTGKYSFILEFNCVGCGRTNASIRNQVFGPQPQTDAPAAAPGDPQDTGGLPSFQTALERQLGLRLVKAKDVPLDVVVIDHVDKVPVEN